MYTSACREGRGQHWPSLLYCFPPSLRHCLTNPGAHGFGKANWPLLPSAPALGDNCATASRGSWGSELDSASQGGTLPTELSSLLKTPSASQGSPHEFTVANGDKLTMQIGISESEGESYNRQCCSRQFLILK